MDDLPSSRPSQIFSGTRSVRILTSTPLMDAPSPRLDQHDLTHFRILHEIIMHALHDDELNMMLDDAT